MASEEERRNQMIASINTPIVQAGFANLKMDQIAKLMGVSRGKLYQYFSSKEDVITAVVDRYFRFMDQQVLPDSGEAKTFAQTFPTVFLQLVTLVASSSDRFRHDLTQSMPDLAQEFNARYTNFTNAVQRYLKKGQSVSVFNSHLNPALFVIQIQATVPTLMNNNVLTHYRLFLTDVLPDYLKMMTDLVVTPKWQEQIDLTQVGHELKELTLKYQQAITQEAIK